MGQGLSQGMALLANKSFVNVFAMLRMASRASCMPGKHSLPLSYSATTIIFKRILFP